MNIQDRKKSFTAEELRQRYNLDGLDKDRKAIQLIKNTINKVEIEFERFMEVINDILKEYPSQANIIAWFFDGIPTSTQPEFTTPSDHLGDLYYDKQTGKVYQYIHDEDYTWEEITDGKVIESMSIENSKADTSDNKRVVFNGTPTTPYSIGDVWIKEGIYYRCRAARESGNYSSLDWVIYTDYTEDMVMLDTRAAIDQLQTNVETNYVSQVQLETNTQGIYATVSSTYATQTTVSTLDGEVQNTKTDVRNLDTRLSVEEGKMTSVISDIGNRTGKTSSLTQEVDEIRAEISDIADITKSAETYEATIADTEFQDIAESTPINIEVHPVGENISYLYPNTALYPTTQSYPAKAGLKPSTTLTPSSSLVPANGYPAQTIKYLKIRKLRFTNTSTNANFDYVLPEDLLYYGVDVYDTLTIDYENRTIRVLKKCKYNTDGTVGLLTTPEEHDYDSTFNQFEEDIALTQGNYTVTLLGYTAGYIFVRLMALNAYTAQYATKIELRTSITQTRDYVDIEAAKKVGNNEVIAKINVSPENYLFDGWFTLAEGGDEISSTTTVSGEKTYYAHWSKSVALANVSPESILISANKINVVGVMTAMNNDTTTTINGGKITTGTITADQLSTNSVNASKIVAGTITAEKIADTTITGSKLVNGTITGTQIANATITGTKIAGATIENSNIKNGTIEGAKIANGTITGTQIQSGTITGALIADSTIVGGKIQDAAITTSKIADASITDAKISNLSADKITAGTISTARLSSDVITTSNFSAQSINADRINTGTLTAAAINLGNGKFKVTTAGYLTSTSGKIGGWTITSSSLSNGNNSNLVAITPGSLSAGGYTMGWADIMTKLRKIP